MLERVEDVQTAAALSADLQIFNMLLAEVAGYLKADAEHRAGKVSGEAIALRILVTIMEERGKLRRTDIDRYVTAYIDGMFENQDFGNAIVREAIASTLRICFGIAAPDDEPKRKE